MRERITCLFSLFCNRFVLESYIGLDKFTSRRTRSMKVKSILTAGNVEILFEIGWNLSNGFSFSLLASFLDKSKCKEVYLRANRIQVRDTFHLVVSTVSWPNMCTRLIISLYKALQVFLVYKKLARLFLNEEKFVESQKLLMFLKDLEQGKKLVIRVYRQGNRLAFVYSRVLITGRTHHTSLPRISLVSKQNFRSFGVNDKHPGF